MGAVLLSGGSRIPLFATPSHHLSLILREIPQGDVHQVSGRGACRHDRHPLEVELNDEQLVHQGRVEALLTKEGDGSGCIGKGFLRSCGFDPEKILRMLSREWTWHRGTTHSRHA